MDRFSWAIALAALLLFAGIAAASSVMTGPPVPPRVSCAGSVTCETVPNPTFTDNPVPPSRSSQLP